MNITTHQMNRRAFLKSVGVCLGGLAISAKFTAIAVLPALVVYLALFRWRDAELRTRTGLPIAAGAAFLSAAVLYLCVWSALVAKVNDPHVLLRGPFALSLVCWAVVLLWAAYARKRSLDPAAAALLVLSLALLTFAVVPMIDGISPTISEKSLMARSKLGIILQSSSACDL